VDVSLPVNAAVPSKAFISGMGREDTDELFLDLLLLPSDCSVSSSGIPGMGEHCAVLM